MLCLYTERLPAVSCWAGAILGGGLGTSLIKKPIVWLLYCGLCRAVSPLASFTAP